MKRRGFSLIELLVAMSLLAIVLGAIIPVGIFFIRSNYKMGEVVMSSTDGRRFLEQLGTDLRSAVDMTLSTKKKMTITVQDPSGNQSTIAYIYNASREEVTRQVDSGTRRKILDDVTEFRFTFYNSNDTPTSVDLDIKKVEVRYTLTDSSFGTDWEESIKSARFVMRKRVSS